MRVDVWLVCGVSALVAWRPAQAFPPIGQLVSGCQAWHQLEPGTLYPGAGAWCALPGLSRWGSIRSATAASSDSQQWCSWWTGGSRANQRRIRRWDRSGHVTTRQEAIKKIATQCSSFDGKGKLTVDDLYSVIKVQCKVDVTKTDIRKVVAGEAVLYGDARET